MAKHSISELAGSMDQNYFVQGLLMASKGNSLGEMWEKCVECPHCLFAKPCSLLGEQMEVKGKNPRCGQVIDILLGDLSPEDESIDNLPYYPEANKSFL